MVCSYIKELRYINIVTDNSTFIDNNAYAVADVKSITYFC